MDFALGPILIAAMSVGVIFGLLLTALLLRSACDLCSVEPPPSYLRCIVVTIILTAISVPISMGASIAAAVVVTALRFSAGNVPFVATLFALPVVAVISTLIFVVAFRVRVLKGSAIWLVNTLINSVVYAVMLLLLFGGWTLVDGVRRLI